MSEAEKYMGYSDDDIGLVSSYTEIKRKQLETPRGKKICLGKAWYKYGAKYNVVFGREHFWILFQCH